MDILNNKVNSDSLLSALRKALLFYAKLHSLCILSQNQVFIIYKEISK